ncbi:type IV pilus modification PilV family protein [Pseudoduganella sp. S-14]|jgi:type IV pilus assembly protein PilV|uniref:type IV pilus modification PilV family protein n=1 Tax=Pseudoduganella sp. S-14 TaxID=3404065 RepID=UPI003CF71A1E
MKSQRTLRKQGGIALVEALVAIVIFAFGVLAIVGLQAASVRQVSDAKYRIDAANVISQSLGAMWADRERIELHAVRDQAVSTLPNGKLTIVVPGPWSAAAGVTVTVTVTWQVPGESAVHTQTSVQFIAG